MKTYKVRIKKAPTMDMGGQMLQDYNPTMAYGGQIGYGLDLNSRRVYTDMPDGKQDGLARTLGPVDRNEATYEAERGEVIVGDFDKDGNHETMTFGGKPHSQGGTPAKEQGFIYSKTKKMALGGPIISEFGKSPGKKYTPAELAKQYDLTKYKAVLDDPNADPLAKRTAELMTDSYKKKLGKLAFVQESVKGFPQGVPQIAAETYPELAEKVMGKQEAPGQEMANEEEEMARYGGYYQNGGAAGRMPVMDPKYLAYINGLNTGRTQVVMPGAFNPAKPNTYTAPAMQNKNKSGVYGEEDWWDAAHQADFRKRHGWYLDNAPGWDPRTPGATEAFQRAYNEQMDQFGDQDYFDGDPRFLNIDGKFGKGTFSAPGLNLKQQPVTTMKPLDIQQRPVNIGAPQIKVPTSVPGVSKTTPAPVVPQKPGENKLPYNRFDVANLMMAAATPVKSYAPRMFQPDVQEMQGYYDQPDYNPLLAAANTRAQMNNTFSNTGAAMAANSYNPELTQGLLQETQRARTNNLQTANSVAQGNVGIRNQSNALNAQLQQDNYDKWVKTQEETDIANKLKWRKDVMPAAQNMVNNRINMQRYNMMYPEYAVTGPYWDQVAFQKGHSLKDNPSASTGAYSMNDYLASDPHLQKIWSGASKEEQIKIYDMFQKQQAMRYNMMGKNPRNVAGNMQMMAGQAGYPYGNPYANPYGTPEVGPYGY